MLELYRSYDGEAAGAIFLALESDGRWTIRNHTHQVLESGTIPPSVLGDLNAFLNYWRDLAVRRANGWANPQFGGCCNPIHMAAVRFRDVEIHIRSEGHAEFGDMEMANREKTILSLIKKLGMLIPQVASQPVFAAGS